MSHHDATTSLLTSDVSQPAGSQTMLGIAREMRSHVGVTVANKCLSEHQLHEAWQFLQREIFEKYMRNYNLRDKIQAYECDPHSFSSTEAQKLDKARRSAFKAWVHSLIGGTAFFADLVKHGLHDAEILHSLVSFIPIRTDNAFPTRTFWSKNHVVLHAPQQVTIPISNHRREISIRFTRTPVQTICFQRQYQLTPGKQAQMVSEKSENTWDEWISWDLL